jgi:aspartyl protease family protein
MAVPVVGSRLCKRGWSALLPPCVVALSLTIVMAEDPRSVLEGKGLRVSSGGIWLPDEADFKKQLSESAKVRKALVAAEKEMLIAEAEQEFLENQLGVAKEQYVLINAQLLAVNQSDIATRNQLAAANNALVGQMELAEGKLRKMDSELKGLRRAASEAREAYVAHVLSLRETADKVKSTWDELAADEAVRSAAAAYAESTKKKIELKPSAAFAAAEKQLKQLEEKVLSEAIPLERRGVNGFHATVVLDGEHKVSMLVDSGAGIICLPHKVAKECGLEPTADDPPIALRIADGSVISGKLKTIKSVRVGKFVVENVECAVLGPEAVAAEPLLGMSFLSKFKFEINADEATLSMVKVETGETFKKSKKLQKSAKPGRKK